VYSTKSYESVSRWRRMGWWCATEEHETEALLQVGVFAAGDAEPLCMAPRHMGVVSLSLRERTRGTLP
jgi:hypothetical protein